MAGHHKGSEVPPEAAPPQHSGVPWLLPERAHSMGESHAVAFLSTSLVSPYILLWLFVSCLKEVTFIFCNGPGLQPGFITANCWQTVKMMFCHTQTEMHSATVLVPDIHVAPLLELFHAFFNRNKRFRCRNKRLFHELLLLSGAPVASFNSNKTLCFYMLFRVSIFTGLGD